MTSTFDVVLFLLSSLVTGPSFMSLSSLFLELWQFSFIRDWPEIRKSEIPTSEFFPISGDWSKLWILILARMSLIECYWMLQNSRVTAFTIFELLRGNHLRGVKLLLPATQIRVKTHFSGIIRFSSRSRLNWNTSKEKVTVHFSISTIDFFRFSSTMLQYRRSYKIFLERILRKLLYCYYHYYCYCNYFKMKWNLVFPQVFFTITNFNTTCTKKR